MWSRNNLLPLYIIEYTNILKKKKKHLIQSTYCVHVFTLYLYLRNTCHFCPKLTRVPPQCSWNFYNILIY